MAWDVKYVKYALVKVECKKVKVYKDRYNFLTINIGENVNNAMWSGDEISVFLTNGKIRRYKDLYNFRNI